MAGISDSLAVLVVLGHITPAEAAAVETDPVFMHADALVPAVVTAFELEAAIAWAREQKAS